MPCTRRAWSRWSFCERQRAHVKRNFGNDTHRWIGGSTLKERPAASLAIPQPTGRRLVLIMATHIDSHGRLMSLVRCLASLEPQRARAYIGWHATESNLRDETRKELARFAARCRSPAAPMIVEAAQQRHQFEHYDALTRLASEHAQADQGGTWCIFSDGTSQATKAVIPVCPAACLLHHPPTFDARLSRRRYLIAGACTGIPRCSRQPGDAAARARVRLRGRCRTRKDKARW